MIVKTTTLPKKFSQKQKASFYKLLHFSFIFFQFEDRFRTVIFSRRISVDDWPNGNFREGLGCTVGLTVEIKLRFRDGSVWTAGLTVEIKLRFRERSVWTVGQTVETRTAL